jgi:3-hydroxyacyl-[acyl-carrier-protein] dehydratase
VVRYRGTILGDRCIVHAGVVLGCDGFGYASHRCEYRAGRRTRGGYVTEPRVERDVQWIMSLLPHRYPFLLVDRILEIEAGKRIVALKNVTINEEFFVGHFPSRPVMPGVLIIEALAQAGGVLLLHDRPAEQRKLVYLTTIERARFRRPVVPGDQLRLEVQVMQLRERFARLGGKAIVDGQTVAEATVSSAMVDS